MSTRASDTIVAPDESADFDSMRGNERVNILMSETHDIEHIMFAAQHSDPSRRGIEEQPIAGIDQLASRGVLPSTQ